MCDYFSGFIEVERLTSTTSTAVSKALKIMFARYEVPNVLAMDNGPHFDSAKFAASAAKWGFQHITSSPRHPQSNGKVENAVKTVKSLFTKRRESIKRSWIGTIHPLKGLVPVLPSNSWDDTAERCCQ